MGEEVTTVKGQVAVVSEKAWNGVNLYSFKVEGDERWYRTGRAKPPFQKGAQVEFQERNSNVLMETIAVTESPTTETPSSVPSASAPTPDTPVASASVGDRLRYQAARRDAANLVVAALNVEGKGLEVLPWAKNTAKGKKLDLLTEYIEQVTKTLLDMEERNATK